MPRPAAFFPADLSFPDVQLLGCAWLGPEEIDVIAATGTAVLLDPTAAMFIGAGMPPLLRLAGAGVPAGLATNGPAANGSQDMFESMKNVAGLAKLAAQDGHAFTQQRALDLATIEGARALGLDGAIGSLEPGKRADLAVWRTDGLELGGADDLPAALVLSGPHRVDRLLVGGEDVVRDGRLVKADEEEIASEHRIQPKPFSRCQIVARKVTSIHHRQYPHITCLCREIRQKFGSVGRPPNLFIDGLPPS